MTQYISTGTIRVNLNICCKNSFVTFFPDKNHTCNRLSDKYAVFLESPEEISENSNDTQKDNIKSVIKKIETAGGVKLVLDEKCLKNKIDILTTVAVKQCNVDVTIEGPKDPEDSKSEEDPKKLRLIGIRIPSTG